MIEVNANGAAQRFEPDTDIAALLERLQLAGKRVAVERNGEIVPRATYAGVFLAEGGNRELGSAMAIALAKGFLMYTARLDLPPVEILRRLRATMGSVLLGENAADRINYLNLLQIGRCLNRAINEARQD